MCRVPSVRMSIRPQVSYLANDLRRQLQAVGMTIRGGDSVYSCLANLTAALELVGQLNQAEYNGAAGALSLLPTAGALLGVPTREMWILCKSVPISGALGVLLSLGGSTTSSNVSDYDPNKPFSFGGFVLTIPAEAPRRPKSHATSDGYGGEDVLPMTIKDRRRKPRSKNSPRRSSKGHRMTVAGAWGWMWFWYFLVTVVVAFDNSVAAPFTQS
ncbi:hypothetical protein NUW58_g1944 [Xylaria curta]|uniref:Uncharacterized protein n=1 Tax=Xylaria curta TaxID=42375 RepID=A0ACC1PKN9_9PEZI|nr:hypothetical protein NUW58_g1944 [Xylaria curta]